MLWDGEMLTINAENSNLSDILVAVRARTGAAIDIPPGADKERLAARLGPGPAREVISTLLSWTDFDYIIQASDTDPLSIQSVLLTPRGKSDTAVADAATYDAAAHRNRWPLSGNTRPPEPSAPAPSSSTEAETSPETPVAAAQPAPAEAQPVAEATPPTAPDADSPQTGARSMLAAQANLNAASSSAGSSSSSGSPVDQGMQTLQNLYQQRIQMIQNARKNPPAN